MKAENLAVQTRAPEFARRGETAVFFGAPHRAGRAASADTVNAAPVVSILYNL